MPVSSESANGVNLSTGHLSFPLTLVTAPGENSLDLDVKLAYSSDIYEQVQNWNQEQPTSICGLGWSLPQTSIVRDTHGTGSSQDDTFYLIADNVSPLVQIGQDGTNIFYAAQNYQFWRIFYTSTEEQWTIVQEDGTTFLLGGKVTRDLNGNKQSAGNSVEWGVKWNNWLGSSSQANQQSQFALVWNLSTAIGSYGQALTFTYTQVQKPTGSAGGLLYTQAVYLTSIGSPLSNEVAFLYAEKDADEYPQPLSPFGQADLYQQRLQTRYLSSLELRNEYGTLLHTTKLSYSFLNTGSMKKRILSSISTLHPDGTMYEPSSLFTYYGQSSEDGVSVSPTDNSHIFNAATRALYGALKSQTAPAGEITTYQYAQLSFNTTERSLKQISAPDASWNQPHITFGSDYTVVVWQKSNQASLSVYQWKGTWLTYSGGTLPTTGGQIKVVAGDLFFVVITPGQTQAAHFFHRDPLHAGQWFHTPQTVTLSAFVQVTIGDAFIALLNFTKLYRYTWREAETTWVSPTEDGGNPITLPFKQAAANHAIAGMNRYFFVVSTPDRVLDASSKPEIRLYSLTASGTWQHQVQTIEWFLPAASTIHDADTASGGSAFRLRLFAGATFVGLQSYGIYVYTIGENVYSQYNSASMVFQWGEDFSQITSKILYTNQSALESDVKSEMLAVVGNLLAIIAQQKKQLYRYDGQTWNTRIISMDEASNFYGDDSTLEVSTNLGTRRTSLQQYNPRTQTWDTQFAFDGVDIHFYQTLLDILGFLAISIATAPFGFLQGYLLGSILESMLANGPLSSGFVRQDILGFRTMTITNSLYYQDGDRSWRKLPDDLLNNTPNLKLVYDLLTLSDQFIAFMTTYQEHIPQPSFDEFRYKNFRNWVWLIRNGQIVKKLTLETADEQARNEASLTTEPSAEQNWLVGANMLVAYPRQHSSPCGDNYDPHSPPCASNFKDTASFNLYRIIGDDLAGSLTSFVVAQVGSFDGYQSVNTFFEYDTSTIALDSVTASPLYNKVTVSSGLNLMQAKAAGWNEFYFYNGSSQALPFAPTDPLFTNASAYPPIVAGQLYHTRAYGSSQLAMTQTLYWQVFQRALANGRAGYFIRLRKQQDIQDGVEKNTEYSYSVPTSSTDTGLYSGLVIAESTRSYDSAGQENLTETRMVYGWQVYQTLQDMHLLDQIVQTTTIRYEPSTASKGYIEQVVVVTWQEWPDRIWAPWRTFDWAGTGSASFTAWNSPEAGEDWIQRSESVVLARGMPIEVRDAASTSTSTIYDKNYHFPIAHFVNASSAHFEAHYTAFERYEDLSAWQIQAQSIDRYLFTEDSYTGKYCLLLPENTSASIHDTPNELALSAGTQQYTFVLSAFIKTQVGFTADPGTASLGLVIYNQNLAQREVINYDLVDSGNSWQQRSLVVDLPTIRTQNGWRNEDVLALGICITNAKASTSLLVDAVHLAPLNSFFTLYTYDADYRLITATINANGLQNRVAYNRLQREIGQVGPDEQVTGLLASSLSRNGNVADRFQARDPNALLTISARSGGSYYGFRGGNAGAWSGGIAINDKLILRSDESASLDNLSGQYGVRLQLDTNFSAPTLKWRASVPKELGQLSTSVAVSANGTVYAGTAIGWLVSFAPNDQTSLAWRVMLEKYGPGEGSNMYCLIGADQTIYATTLTGHIYAVTPGGTRKWSYSNNNGTTSVPALGQNDILYTADYLALHAINPANGTELWSFPYPQRLQDADSNATVAVGPDQTVYVGLGSLRNTPRGLLYALNPNRQQKWSQPFATDGGIIRPPAIAANGTIYISTQSGKLYALRSDGTPLWSKPTQLDSGIAYTTPVPGHSGTIYIAGSRIVYALNADGSLKWQYVVDSSIAAQIALDAHDNCYVTFDDGRTSGTLALRADGIPLWTAPFTVSDFEEGQIEAGPIIGSDGTIYVNNAVGQNIYALLPTGENAQSKSITVSLGSIQIKYQAGAYTFYDGLKQIGNPLVAPLASDWLILSLQQTLLFYANGRQLFTTTSLTQSSAGSLQLSTQGDDNSGVAFHDIFIFQDPMSSVSYIDGSLQVRQQQQMESSNAIILTEKLYDERGKLAFTTIPARKHDGAAYPSVFGFEDGFVEGRDPASANALWDRTLSNPQHGVMRGLIQKWLDPQAKTDYPYVEQTYEQNSLARLSQTTAPETQFIYAASHAIQYSYDLNATAQSLLRTLAIPDDKMNHYQASSRALPLDDRKRILTVSLQNTEQQQILEGAIDQNGQMQLFAASYSAQPASQNPAIGLTKTTYFPNYYSSSKSFQAVENYDRQNMLVQQTTVDSKTNFSIYNQAGQLRFLLDATGSEMSPTQILYAKYDELGRQIEIGSLSMPWDQKTLQNYAYHQPAWPTTGTPLKLYFYDRIKTEASITSRGRLVQAVVTQDQAAREGEASQITTTLTYDSAGNRLTSSVVVPAFDNQIRTTSYTYDRLGNVTSIHYPMLSKDRAGLVVTYTYNLAGQLISIGKAENTTAFATYSYNADGSINQESLNGQAGNPGNTVLSYGYNSLGWLTSIADTHFFREDLGYQDAHGTYLSGDITSTRFTFQPTVRVGDMQASDYTYTYTYDAFHQLVQAQHSLDQELDILIGKQEQDQIVNGYDANGNILLLQTGRQQHTYTYLPGTNQLDAITETGQRFSYTASGAVKETPTLAKLDYDPLTHRPRSVLKENAQTRVVYQYSSNNEQALKSIQQKDASDNWQVAEQTLSLQSNEVRPLQEIHAKSGNIDGQMQYIYGPTGLVALDDGGTEYFVIKDHLESTRVVFTSANEVVAFFNYAPFGGLLERNSVNDEKARRFKRRYTGQEYDFDLGLYNYRARLYDSTLGRFYAPDPAHQFASPYAYVGNNPLNRVDPTGEVWWPSGRTIAGLATAAGGLVAAGIYHLIESTGAGRVLAGIAAAATFVSGMRMGRFLIMRRLRSALSTIGASNGNANHPLLLYTGNDRIMRMRALLIANWRGIDLNNVIAYDVTTFLQMRSYNRHIIVLMHGSLVPANPVKNGRRIFVDAIDSLPRKGDDFGGELELMGAFVAGPNDAWFIENLSCYGGRPGAVSQKLQAYLSGQGLNVVVKGGMAPQAISASRIIPNVGVTGVRIEIGSFPWLETLLKDYGIGSQLNVRYYPANRDPGILRTLLFDRPV